eukprot:7929948-Pyramimonas_sp.AAC.1
MLIPVHEPARSPSDLRACTDEPIQLQRSLSNAARHLLDIPLLAVGHLEAAFPANDPSLGGRVV